MIYRAVNFVLVLRCFGRAADGKAVSVKLDGVNFRPEYRDGGYLVFVDILEGTHEVELRGAVYQSRTISVSVDKRKPVKIIVNLTPLKQINSVPQITIKLAQDTVKKGESEAKLYYTGKMYDLPCEFIADKDESAEKCVICDISDGIAQFESPLTKTHRRGAVFALCTD